MTSYIGSATPRIDGRAKVTGAAKYAADFNEAGLAFGAVVTSTISRGRIKRIDTSDALAVAGVIKVLTHDDRPRMAATDEAWRDDVAPEGGSPFRPLYDDRILFDDQPIALVLAEDWEIARLAAALVRVEYERQTHATDLHAALASAYVVQKPEKPRGDAAKAFAAAAVRHEAEYFIPTEHHNPMELFASTVQWEGGGKLTVCDKTQGVQNVHGYLCKVFDKKAEDVRVLSPYMGGGFGAGLRPQYQVVLAVLGALALQRSVRLVLTRQQMYGLGYRPATIERLALGAKADGTLDAITHEAIAVTSQFEAFFRNDTSWAALLYKSDTAHFVHKLVRLDVPTSSDMRAPGAATGVYALESAMDELAVALKLDPVELRLRCYSDRDQNENLPYSSKELRECYRQGAEAFGWSKRDPEPRSMRDGNRTGRLGNGVGRVGGAAGAGGDPHCADRQRIRGGRMRGVRHRHRHVHDRRADGGRQARPADRERQRQARQFQPCRRRPWKAARGWRHLLRTAVAATADEIRTELLALAKRVKESPLRERRTG